MKAYLIITGLFLLVGLWPPLLTPLALIASGITATFTTLPVWFLALALAAGITHHKLTRHRPRTIRTRNYAWKA